jgi:processive 1,2-diacylglycerol beta-glucosyltransferase
MKRIDLYTIDIGGGHIAPAQAIKQQFDLLGYKDLEVHVVNLGIVLGARFLRYLYKFYWNNALRYPPLINGFYRGADNPFMIKIVDRILGITILPKFVAYLEREKPDLVVSTYFTFTHYLELLKRVGQLDAVSVVLNPEPFDSHMIWFSPALDWSMVFSRKSRDEIIEKPIGIQAGRVKVFSFPIKPSFARRTESKAVLRKRLGLQQKRFTVLLFFGAEGVGPMKKILAMLVERRLDLQVAVVCGRNERLKTDIESFARGPTGSLSVTVRGFVTNLADYIAAADVVVGKSGPNQVFETLLQQRPIIISSYLANEWETTNWVISNHLGWLTRTPGHLATLLAKLARRPAILEEYQGNIRKMDLRSGTPEICEFLYAQVKKKRAPRKPTVGEALRKFRDVVKAESEAFTRRIEDSEGVRFLKEMGDAGKRVRAETISRRDSGPSKRATSGPGSPRPAAKPRKRPASRRKPR